MTRIFGLVLWSLILLCFGVGATMVEPGTDAITCNTTYNMPNGEVKYFNRSDTVPASVPSCEWNIMFNDTKDKQEVFLVFEEFLLHDKDSVTIYENVNSTRQKLNIGPYSGSHGAFMVLTGAQNITVELHTSADLMTRKFQMHYYTTLGCTHNLTSVKTGTVSSPTYDTKRTDPIDCTFSIAPYSKESFKLSTLVTPVQMLLDDLQLSVTGSELADKTYKGGDFPSEFTSKDALHLKLDIKPNGKTVSQVNLAYEIVTKECSGTFKLAKSSATSTFNFKNPTSTEASVSETPSLNCRYLVFTEESSVVALTVSVDNLTLPGPLDLLQVLNGSDRQAASILQLTSTSEWEDKYIMANRKDLSISLISSFPSPKMNLSITVGMADYGGYFKGNGTIGVIKQQGDPAIFLLEVDPKQQVKLDLGKARYKEGNLKLYYNFEKEGTPFAELADLRSVGSFISPSPLMMVQASGFSSESFSATFGSVERGCFSVSTEEMGSYNLFGSCTPICAWTIAAKRNASDKDLRKLHFSSLNLNADDTLRIVKINTTIPLANVTGPLRRMPDFYLPSKDGFNVVVERNCTRNATAVVADFAPSPRCELNVTLETGTSFVLSSPGFPNNYPVNSDCKWNIHAKKTDLIHVSFESLRLGGSDHTLSLYRNVLNDDTLLVKFVGPTGPNDTLPEDYIVTAANLTVDFGGGLYNRSIADSAYGFQINLTAASCGGVMYQQTGTFNNTLSGKGNTSDAKLCFWLVGVNATAKTKNIALYNISSPASLKGYLDIHDGSSVRDPLSSNLTGNNLMSRLDKLLFVYRNPNTAAGPAFTVTFNALACNASCDNGICLHADWLCNGINDCGDWSDEKNCNSTCPQPIPTPSPPPPPSPSGVSNTALALAILAALLIGALLGFAAPAAYRRIRTGQFGSYSSFTNNVDT